MNLAGNVLSMKNIMNEIAAANANCDLASVAYNYGRLVKVIMQVDPIEEVEEATLENKQHSSLH